MNPRRWPTKTTNANALIRTKLFLKETLKEPNPEVYTLDFFYIENCLTGVIHGEL